MSPNDETARLAEPAAARKLEVRQRLRGEPAVVATWLLGSAIVTAAQPGLDQ